MTSADVPPPSESTIGPQEIAPGLNVERRPSEPSEDRYITLSIGPQHPGAGHMRIIVVVDGDIIVHADPDVGYVHRGEEKMSEYRTFVQNVPHIERPVIHDSSNILYSYCLAVEELLGIQVPERGKYLRAIMAEIDRIHYTLYWLAILGIFNIGYDKCILFVFHLKFI